AAAASKLPMKTMLGFAPQMGAIPGAPASTAPVPGAPGLAPGFHSAPTPLAPPVSQAPSPGGAAKPGFQQTMLGGSFVPAQSAAEAPAPSPGGAAKPGF